MENTRKRLLLMSLVATLAAVCIHLYLARQHYGLKYGMATNSVCNINATLNCDAVAASPYSHFLTIPMAVWGMSANLVLAFFLLITLLGWSDDTTSTGRMTLWLATLIALASVGMAAISFGLMSVYCVFCMAAYVLSLLGWLGAWKGTEGYGNKPLAVLFQTLNEQRWLIFAGLSVPLIAYLGHVVTEKNMGVRDTDRFATEFVVQWQASPEKKFDPNLGLVLQTSGKEPKMTIIEFADFLCPHCQHAYPALHAFTQAHPDVKLVYKFFPLDGTCNPIGGQGNGIRCTLAYIAHCEEKLRQKGWEAHHYFYDHIEEMMAITDNGELVDQYCKSPNAPDCTALKACVESTETKDAVRALAQEGVTAGVEATPSIFVNGKLLSRGQLLPVLEKAYQSLLHP